MPSRVAKRLLIVGWDAADWIIINRLFAAGKLPNLRRLVESGARADLGHLEQAMAVLSSPPLDPTRTGGTPARLFYAYAETLLALGRTDEALQWFMHSAAADIDGVTDAEDRIDELA